MRRITMAKRIIIVSVLVLFLAGFSFAGGQQEPAAATGQKLTLRGSITFENLMHPTLKSGDKVYELLVPRYLAYQAGLKDGAEIAVEGYQVKDLPAWAGVEENETAVFVTKATINGKDYDLSQYHGGMMDGSYGQGGRMMGGRGPGWGPGVRGFVN
jgi:hypothetical protein